MKPSYNKHRYRLIAPIVGNKIYMTSSLKHGAKKCFQEINVIKNKFPEFAILNIDTYETFRFKVNHKKTKTQNITIGSQNGDEFNYLATLNSQIAELKQQIHILETKFDNNATLHPKNDEIKHTNNLTNKSIFKSS
jgi:hypothetical protein